MAGIRNIKAIKGTTLGVTCTHCQASIVTDLECAAAAATAATAMTTISTRARKSDWSVASARAKFHEDA